jgi:hypothetical protein
MPLPEQTTSRVKSIIEQMQDLTPVELLTLMQAICQLLGKAFHPFSSKTLDELRLEQGSKVIQDASQLQADFWPEVETMEEFEQYLAEERATYGDDTSA